MDMNKVLADFIREVVSEELDKRLADLRVIQKEPLSKAYGYDVEFDFSDCAEDAEEEKVEKDVGWDGYPEDNGWDDDDCALPVAHKKTPKDIQHEKQTLKVWSGTTELANKVGVNPSTIRNWIQLGFLKSRWGLGFSKVISIVLNPDAELLFKKHLDKYFLGAWDIDEIIEMIKNG